MNVFLYIFPLGGEGPGKGADEDKEIFVSRYQLQLPDKKELERFIRDELRKRL